MRAGLLAARHDRAYKVTGLESELLPAEVSPRKCVDFAFVPLRGRCTWTRLYGAFGNNTNSKDSTQQYQLRNAKNTMYTILVRRQNYGE
jgi:hypothetical protein